MVWYGMVWYAPFGASSPHTDDSAGAMFGASGMLSDDGAANGETWLLRFRNASCPTRFQRFLVKSFKTSLVLTPPPPVLLKRF